MNSFGKRMRHVISEKGISFKQASEDLGISLNGISNYINDRRIPGVDLISEFCRIYSVDPKWMLFGEEYTNDSDHENLLRENERLKHHIEILENLITKLKVN
ncbi:MAG: helix-turn-helix transcriptional regulator [Candidatus Delongbacteria bacterium]|nr:helix-turn-helix transcriptional regulator [Candidatus Delongbacteria bacterium]MBN2837043.1 helix-turn-helix transcriptional regulator [Candidatus Delongbacteria bacterium]